MATTKAKPKTPPKPTTLDLWNKVCVTDPDYTRWVDQRGGFTCIDAQWQLWQATELWGPYGKAWGVRALDYQTFIAEGRPCGISLKAEFFCPESAFEIATDMEYKPRDDTHKKLLTDLTTKALSKLGFSADVFFGLYDDSKYVETAKQRYADHRKGQNAPAEPEGAPEPASEPPPDQPDPVEPNKVGEPFVGPFTLSGLEGAVTIRLFKDQKPLLKAYMPNTTSTKEARQHVLGVVKRKITNTEGLSEEEQINGETAERFFHATMSQIMDEIAARDS